MKKVMRFGAVTDSPNPGSFVAAARGRLTGPKGRRQTRETAGPMRKLLATRRSRSSADEDEISHFVSDGHRLRPGGHAGGATSSFRRQKAADGDWQGARGNHEHHARPTAGRLERRLQGVGQ